MFKYLLFLLIAVGCSSSPVSREHVYKGEPLNKIGENGLLLAHVQVPLDDFPHDRRTTIIYFENIKTKAQYHYGDTRGPIYMKLPPGDYRVTDFWKPSGCNHATGVMISNFFHELPSQVQHLRSQMEKEPASSLNFRIGVGKMTDLGNMLVTCMEWNERARFKKDFVDFIEDGKFQMFKLTTPEASECGCKILRKKDGVSQREMKKALAED